MKALIITVGTGIGPSKEAVESIAQGIAFSIRHHNPDLVVCLVTEESQKQTLPVVEELCQGKQFKVEKIKDKDDVNHIYEVVGSQIKRLKEKGYDIAVDFTSGTKSMSAGAVLAATTEEVEISYVTGVRVEGKVVRGTEKAMSYSPIMGSIRIQEKIMEELFNLHQYEACLAIIDNIMNRVLVPEIVERFRLFKQIVEGYSSWDKFDHETAREKLLKVATVPDENKEFLGKLRSEKEERMKFLIADLLNNAGRRAVEGKYDDAVARLYRNIELIAQLKLKEKGIETFNVDLNKIPLESREKLEKEKDSEGRIRIGLAKAYDLLNNFEDKLGKRFVSDENLKNLLRKRNESILAHGLTPITLSDYEQLYQIVMELGKYVVADLEILLEKSKFPLFSELMG